MRMIPVIIFSLFIIFIDAYSFFGLRSSLFYENQKVFLLIYLLISAGTIAGIVLMFNTFTKMPINHSLLMNMVTGLTFSIIIAKLHFTSFFIVEDLLRSFLWVFQSAANFRVAEFLSRSFFWGLVTFISGGVLIVLLNYGVWFGKYHFKVRHKTIAFSNLPKEFDGFKIAQISDTHLGTFDDVKKVKEGLKLLQQQNPDLIVFTGDMVNNKAKEALIYIDAFKKLEAPFGKFAILGNYDYGSYVKWKTKEEKIENLNQLIDIGKQMGFEWLENRYVNLAKNGDTIYLAGVENWGLPPFPQYGDLEKAIEGISDSDFVILLSHDPTHWRNKVLKSVKKIALTLSGHTHGMQFGFELGNLRWSPVKYKYPDWADLHESNGQYLYVNRGFGNIGYPGRLGIRPEITIIELQRN